MCGSKSAYGKLVNLLLIGCIVMLSFFLLCILILCRYVDVILQLIDKAGDFVSDDIWFRVVQFVTNNEDLQVRMLCCIFTLLDMFFLVII